MYIFRANRKSYLINEFVSWLWAIFFVTILYFGFKLFSHLTKDELIPIVIGSLILKLGDALTQYHITQVQIDKQQKQLLIILNSPISGEKVKKYELEKVSSEIHKFSGIKKYLYSPVLLKIFVVPKGTFRINSRYGFKAETLISVADVLESKSRPFVAQ